MSIPRLTRTRPPTTNSPAFNSMRLLSCAAECVPSQGLWGQFMARLLGLLDRNLIAHTKRLKQALDREGIIGLARRKAAQANSALAERSTVIRFRDRSWQPDRRPVFLLVSHNCGGGTERHVRDLAVLLAERRHTPHPRPPWPQRFPGLGREGGARRDQVVPRHQAGPGVPAEHSSICSIPSTLTSIISRACRMR